MGLNLSGPKLLLPRTQGGRPLTFFDVNATNFRDNFWGSLNTFMWQSTTEGNGIFNSTETGLIKMTSSTSDNQGVMFNANFGGRKGSGGFDFSARVRKTIPGNNTGSIFIGMGGKDPAITDIIDGSDNTMGFLMEDGDQDTITPVHNRSGVGTSGTAITTIENLQWNTFRVVVASGGTSVDFYLNGLFLETITPSIFNVGLLRGCFVIRTENTNSNISTLDISWVKMTLPSPE